MLMFQPDGCHQSVNGKKTAVMSFICRNLHVIGRESNTINVSLTKLEVNVFFKKKINVRLNSFFESICQKSTQNRPTTCKLLYMNDMKAISFPFVPFSKNISMWSDMAI